MSQDRVLGSSCHVEMFSIEGPIPIAEFDKFDAERQSEQLVRHPLGLVGEEKQDIYLGYHLTFNHGKVDASLPALMMIHDLAALAGQPNPRFQIIQTIQFADGTIELNTYPDAIIYGFKQAVDSAKSEITENFEGWARTCVRV